MTIAYVNTSFVAAPGPLPNTFASRAPLFPPGEGAAFAPSLPPSRSAMTWRSLKHQWLFLNTLDSVARVRALVEFYVNEHNTKMPHPAFAGQTSDKMFFETGGKVPEELVLARSTARAARLAANRAVSCELCLGQQVPPTEAQIPL